MCALDSAYVKFINAWIKVKLLLFYSTATVSFVGYSLGKLKALCKSVKPFSGTATKSAEMSASLELLKETPK